MEKIQQLEKSVMVLVEWFPGEFDAWAKLVGAYNVVTGEVMDARLDAETSKALESVVYEGYNGWTKSTDERMTLSFLKDELAKLNVTLASATDAIDETPVGQLMQGMLAVINEYESKESGADIAYKMGEKAKHGGTLGLAPLGYKNVIDNYEGRRIRTVEVDRERGPFVRLAFELYASGEYTLNDVADELTDRGLATRPTAKRPAGPVSVSKLHRMLKDRYYLGFVSYRGEEYPGRYEALIDDELFDKVQGIARSRGTTTSPRAPSTAASASRCEASTSA